MNISEHHAGDGHGANPRDRVSAAVGATLRSIMRLFLLESVTV